MITNDSSLKEYYTNLSHLYENAMNLLTAINQSLSTSASEITVNITQNDNSVQSVRIPSFLYLENKLEQLDMNMSNLWDIPESGEAWFEKSSNMYKLKLVRSNTSPIQPTLTIKDEVAGITDNNILRDMVSPKTYYRINIDNIPDNIEHMIMKKIIIHNEDIFNSLKNLNISSYADYTAALYNLKIGSDYEEYESILDMPVKKDTYNSKFKIIDIPEIENNTNPYNDGNKLIYKLEFDTLEYSNQEDESIVFTVKVGDYLCLGNELCIYKVKQVNTEDNTVLLEEYIGHIALQSYEENTSMVLQIYNESYAAYHYIDVPLEENAYILVFLATVYNGVRSLYSDGILINLNTVYIKDNSNNFILDNSGNKLTYIDYYNKYCKNIGDLILGLTQAAYPQLSNYTAEELNTLQNGEEIKNMISSSINAEDILQVVSINKHLTDDSTADDIINLHAQKNDLNAQLQTLQANIDDTYTTLINTDFSQNVTVSQSALQDQITEYYSQRTEIQKQLNSVIDNINTKATALNISTAENKYRIRGIIDYTEVENYLHSEFNEGCNIVGLDVEYKYKNTSKDTTQITTINGNTFTDWNRLNNIDRQRRLVFTNSGYSIEFTPYELTDNIIKWNQIDIPIRSGEDVVIRIRYKYNIGQPFINIYSVWSNEVTVSFPTEFTEDVQIDNILTQNGQDSISSSFSKTLINDGYQEHIQNKVVSNAQVFYHNADSIYSGFNTAENNLISLKDKLNSMISDIEKYKSFIEQQTNSKFDVYLVYDNNQVLLSPNAINKINIYNTDHITDMFIKKNMNIIIKNTGDTSINLYSIFPGDTNTLLLKSDNEFYNEYIVNYERVPLFFNDSLDGQYLGQWIYFRSNNPYTKKDIYFNNNTQNILDYVNQENNKRMSFIYSPLDNYINIDNQQVLLGYKRRASIEHNLESLYQDANDRIKAVNASISYFDVTNEQNIIMNNIYTQHIPDNTPAYFTTSLVENNKTQKFTAYSYYNGITNNTINCYLYNSYGDTKQPQSINEIFYHTAYTDNNTYSLILNTIEEIYIGNSKTAYYTYNKAESSSYDWQTYTSIDYTLRSTESLTDVTESYYVEKMITDDIDTLSKANNEYSYNYIYNEYYSYSDKTPYGNKTSNKYIVKYEDIIGVDNTKDKKSHTLDASTSLTKFIGQYNVAIFKDNNDNTTANFNGGFLYPNLSSKAQILTNGTDTGSKSISVGESVNIPIVFEYYIDGNNKKQITKSLFFDLRNSLISNPLHYMIEITGNYDYTTTGNIYSNIDTELQA